MNFIGMGWGWTCSQWGWGGDGLKADEDGWGWGNLLMSSTVTLFNRVVMYGGNSLHCNYFMLMNYISMYFILIFCMSKISKDCLTNSVR